MLGVLGSQPSNTLGELAPYIYTKVTFKWVSIDST